MKYLLLLLCIQSVVVFGQQKNQEPESGFTSLFDGRNLDKWEGNKADYIVENGLLVLHPENKGGSNLFTIQKYADFDFRFEFKLSPGGNNGIGIRAPLQGDAAYMGMEIQILDDYAPEYKDLHNYQYHGSVYGVIPAKRGFLKAAGEWNEEKIIAKGNRIIVELNGTVILDGDISIAAANGTMDHKDHPGLFNKKGHIGLLWHETPIEFRHIRVKPI
jgi:Domain of Unknown Function (DUF1080)